MAVQDTPDNAFMVDEPGTLQCEQGFGIEKDPKTGIVSFNFYIPQALGNELHKLDKDKIQKILSSPDGVKEYMDEKIKGQFLKGNTPIKCWRMNTMLKGKNILSQDIQQVTARFNAYNFNEASMVLDYARGYEDLAVANQFVKEFGAGEMPKTMAKGAGRKLNYELTTVQQYFSGKYAQERGFPVIMQKYDMGSDTTEFKAIEPGLEPPHIVRNIDSTAPARKGQSMVYWANAMKEMTDSVMSVNDLEPMAKAIQRNTALNRHKPK